VFVELVADHFLARNFAMVQGEPLADFSSRAYATLAEHITHFPAPAVRFFQFMQERDLFRLYLGVASVERAFGHICERLRRPELLEPSMTALHARYDEFEQDFLRYYPALRHHASEWLAGESRSADH
jgi:acyl carrier protein phosphodiesterase